MYEAVKTNLTWTIFRI